MNQRYSNTGPKNGHLFTVEILIEDETNGLAMEKLLHLLNVDTIKDYQILKGIQLGQIIELNTKQGSSASLHTNKKPPAPSAIPVGRATHSEAAMHIIEQLEKYKANNTLIRLTVIKAQGIKLNLPCRILNYDASSQNVTVYHVDEKKVYLFKLNEIEDFMTTD